MHLETARLTLREYADDDYADLREIDEDVEVQRYRGGFVVTEEQTRRWLGLTRQYRDATPRVRYPLVVARKDTAEVIGAILFGLTHVNRCEAELGYLFKRRHWGLGYATEACQSVLAYAFDTLQLQVVWAQVNPENFGSWRVMEKLGMRREEHRRGVDATADGEWRDVYVYALDATDWVSRIYSGYEGLSRFRRCQVTGWTAASTPRPSAGDPHG